MNTGTQNINNLQIANEFYEFVNAELLSDPTLYKDGSQAEFWTQFTTALDRIDAMPDPVSEQNRSVDVSLLNPRYALKTVNARWGSLYSALYHESAIPHSAGLKTGQRYNVARGTRVIAYAKEFLDSAFPLSEGSHKDAVSYMVYFQDMMVTLADGSTVGLETPAQFKAKSGPKNDPDIIVLRNGEIHVEMQFDRAGTVGSGDLANIQDILVEAPAKALLGCDAQTIHEKCDILRNLDALATGKLRVNYRRDGKNRVRRLHRNYELTAREEGTYTVEGCNTAVLRMNSSATCPAVSDDNGNPLPAAAVDTALFTLITQNRKNIPIELMAADEPAFNSMSAVIEQLQSHCASADLTIELLKDYQNDAKDHPNSADIRAQEMPWIRVAEEELRNTVTLSTQNDAVLKAIHQHGMPH